MSDLFKNNTFEIGPVECLGQKFPNDEARREHFLAILREKLKDPDFRTIEGFPIGTDEDILTLSDPPYYTPCPNPFIEDFINFYGKAYESSVPYNKEPFASDVSEGKTDPIYNAHSYHTKVPHKAIMRYILHYTQPGDIVYDGFCGTGMTGVAAQMCGDSDVVMSLGYRVELDGTILQKEIGIDGKIAWKPFSKLGARRAVLNDLSTAATFIAYNYNSPFDINSFEKDANVILDELHRKCDWMYETNHADSKTKGLINYTVWSDIFVCPECAGEIVFWDSAVNHEEKRVDETFPCPTCSAQLKKSGIERSWITKFDIKTASPLKVAKQTPVLIVYSIPGSSRTYQKKPDSEDLELLKKIENLRFDGWFPTNELPEGANTRQPLLSHGVKYVHQFYTRRNLYALSNLNSNAHSAITKFILTGIACRSTLMNRIHINNFFHGGGGWNAGYLKGTLYIPSIPIETSIIEQVKDRIKSIIRAFTSVKLNRSIIETGSSTSSRLGDNTADYIFIDPPFGANINYSELNSIWESWLSVHTNNKLEAIENSTQNKGLLEYRQLMMSCFREAYRVLKPGHWMTVEFSNTKASVWNSIQTALNESGFIIANVSALDKQQGSFKAVTTPTAVKQDLIISAYKPNGGMEERFNKAGGNEDSVWDFVRTHLKYLPLVKIKDGQLEFITERDPRIIFDRLVAWFVRHNFPVPLSSQEFQGGLSQRFSDRDGMVFLPEQVTEYDKKRMQTAQAPQMELFIADERSAIDWLINFLKNKPSTSQEIQPEFLRQLGVGWKKHEVRPELSQLLESNFLVYDPKAKDGHEIPSQIHSYLSTNWAEYRNLEKSDPRLKAKAADRWYVPDPNKAQELEKLREKSLLKEFEIYKTSTLRKLKEFRLEAVRAGFKFCWGNRDYATIMAVAKKIPDDVLQEDEKLLLWYDQAVTRTEDIV